MASKLKSQAITQADIEEYLDGYADFSFELRVLKQLTDLKLQCQHGGTYDDPITGKTREFDIRALYQDEGFIRVHLSVECKNLQHNFPLVAHCPTRKGSESYNELIHSSNPEQEYANDPSPALILDSVKTIRLINKTLYPRQAYVAKSVDQVGRRNDGLITATDGGVFEKISQAVNSSRDLISEAYSLDASQEDRVTLVCPVLVVPDSTLWQVKYSDDGALVGSPEPVNHVSYFIGKEWVMGVLGVSYSISHLEIVTFSELKSFVTEYLWNYIKACYSADRTNTLN